MNANDIRYLFICSDYPTWCLTTNQYSIIYQLELYRDRFYFEYTVYLFRMPILYYIESLFCFCIIVGLVKINNSVVRNSKSQSAVFLLRAYLKQFKVIV